MSQFFDINQAGSRVNIVFPLNGDNFTFTFDCGQNWVARLLYNALLNEQVSRIQAIRKQEYDQGLRDAKKAKEFRKATVHDFRGDLEFNRD